MQIIIPVSGFGKMFRCAGYKAFLSEAILFSLFLVKFMFFAINREYQKAYITKINSVELFVLKFTRIF